MLHLQAFQNRFILIAICHEFIEFMKYYILLETALDEMLHRRTNHFTSKRDCIQAALFEIFINQAENSRSGTSVRQSLMGAFSPCVKTV